MQYSRLEQSIGYPVAGSPMRVLPLLLSHDVREHRLRVPAISLRS